MTVVRERNGNGHAVLMVRTDRGDLVLDNQNARVLVWQDTPYEFIKRQSQSDPGKWVGIADSRGTKVAAANGSGAASKNDIPALGPSPDKVAR
jgi:hypothetical protein